MPPPGQLPANIQRARHKKRAIIGKTTSQGRKHMSLVHCFECQREISDQARTCPNCGAPVHQHTPVEQFGNKIQIIMAWFIFFISLGAFLWDNNALFRPGEYNRYTGTIMLICLLWWLFVRLKMWFERD
jgi:hypothetical protein